MQTEQTKRTSHAASSVPKYLPQSTTTTRNTTSCKPQFIRPWCQRLNSGQGGTDPVKAFTPQGQDDGWQMGANADTDLYLAW